VGCGLWDDTGHQTSSEFIEQLLTSLHLRDIEICVCLHRTRCGDDAGPTVGFGGYQRYIIPYKKHSRMRNAKLEKRDFGGKYRKELQRCCPVAVT
jgi:hypothetical protein